MANHKSAIKKARMSLRRQAINHKTMSEVRTLEKSVRKAIASKDKKASETALVAYSSKIGKAAQKGRLKFETASRKVSRLSKAVSALA